MKPKNTAIVVTLFSVLLILQTPLSAQTGDSCYMTRGMGWWNYFPLPGELCHEDYAYAPSGQSYTCARRFFSCPSPKSNCPSCTSAGSPISLGSGNTYVQQSDVSLPGLGGGLSLVRTYNSIWPSWQSASKTGIFGSHWRSTYEERVFLDDDASIVYSRGDGSFWFFGYDPQLSIWRINAPANMDVRMTVTDTAWTITFKNGEKRVFQPSGPLSQIIDRNGNVTQLSYDAFGRLVTVTDPASRQITFAYVVNGFLVASVSSSGGTLQYAYDTSNRLVTVTKPDSQVVSFEYSGDFLTAVKDSTGKILESHTYDECGRGLTSSRANGVDSLTVSYSDPCPVTPRWWMPW